MSDSAPAADRFEPMFGLGMIVREKWLRDWHSLGDPEPWDDYLDVGEVVRDV